MDYPKFIVLIQKEESISIQRIITKPKMNEKLLELMCYIYIKSCLAQRTYKVKHLALFKKSPWCRG